MPVPRRSAINSGPADERRGLPAVGVWNPGTGQLKIIGRALDVLDTVTPPGASYSLLAWSTGCLRRCQLGITNTSTLARVTVRSPGRYGFTYGPFSLVTEDVGWAGGCQAAGSSPGPNRAATR